MKHLSTFSLLSIMLLTLNGCNNEADVIENFNDSIKQSEQTSTPSSDSEIAELSEDSSAQQSLTSSKESEDNQEQNEPSFAINKFRNAIDAVIQEQNQSNALNNFRNAIDAVVQDSIQEDVEKAVEDEVAKNTEKKG